MMLALGIVIGLLIALMLLAVELLLVHRTQSTIVDKARTLAQHMSPQEGYIGVADTSEDTEAMILGEDYEER